MSHPSEDRLAAYVEGGLKGPEREDVLAHIAQCEPCRSAVSDLEFVSSQAARLQRWPATGEGSAAPLRARLDAACVKVAAALPPRAARRVGFFSRARYLPIAALAASLLLAVVLMNRQDNFQEAMTLIWEPGVEGMRGAEAGTVHFELELKENASLWLVEWSSKGVRSLIPHENSALGNLGVPVTLPARTPVRVPNDPLVDFEAAPRGEPQHWVLMLFRDLPDAAARAQILAQWKAELLALPVADQPARFLTLARTAVPTVRHFSRE